MSLPAINHLCWVVADLDEAIRFWTGVMRVGPFFVSRHVEWAELEVEGKPARIDISTAFAWRDGIQIELVEQHDDAPSVFNLFPAVGGGVQHTGLRTEDPARAEAGLSRAGLRVVQRGLSPSGTRTIYMHGGPGAGVVEVIGVADGGAFLKKMQDAAAAWDGVTPVAS